MTSNKALSTLLLSLISLCSYATRHSEIADSVEIKAELGEVKVASIKTNKHNLTPASVTLVGPTLLRTQQLVDMTDLSGILPNFYMPDYGSKQTTPIAIRGIMSKIKSTAVGFYIDGIPHFEISSFDSDMLDVKAIEIFRGPQGTLYGRNTLGGVINIYTHSPFEYQGTKVKIGHGNYNVFNAQVSNHTMVDENIGFCAGGYYKHKGGYFNNLYLNKKADKSNEAGAKIGLYIHKSKNWDIRLICNYDYVDQGGYPYAPYDNKNNKATNVNYNRECGFQRTMSTNGLNVNYNKNGISINSQTTLQIIEEEVKMDQDYSIDDNYFINLDIKQTAISEELTIKSDNNNRLQWVAGAFFFHQTRDYLSDTEYIKLNYHSVNDYTLPTIGLAAYAQIAYNIVSNLSTTAGIRLDYEKNSDNYHSYKITDTDRTTKNYFDSDLTTIDIMPKFGLQYKWNKNTIFANITRGCKAGGFNTVFETDNERTYNDEYNWNYETGVKITNSDKKIDGELTIFYIDWRHQHISRTIPGIGNVIYNAGHSDSKGIEASITARPLTGLFLQANYGYTHARFIDYRKSDKDDFSGNMIPMVPRNTVSILASYSKPVQRILDMLTFSMNANGIGSLYWLEDNNVKQPFYTLLGAKIALQKKIATIELWGRNICNTNYLSYYFMSSRGFAQNGTPATFGITINLKI